jgi:hypothetical protein
MAQPTQFLLPLLFCLPLAAQGLLITPQPPIPDPGVIAGPFGSDRPAKVRVTRTGVKAAIEDGVATTTVEQVFRNDGGARRRGHLVPAAAGRGGGRRVHDDGGRQGGRGGSARRQPGARRLRAIVRQRRDPGLLEYAGEGLLRARIYPIPANGEVGVKVRMRQVLQPTGGLYEWLAAARGAVWRCRPDGPIGLSVKIQFADGAATVIAPYAAAEIRRNGEHEAMVSLEGDRRQLEDLKVLYGLSEQEFGLHLLPWRDVGNPGYFTMLLSPPRSLAREARRAAACSSCSTPRAR